MNLLSHAPLRLNVIMSPKFDYCFFLFFMVVLVDIPSKYFHIVATIVIFVYFLYKFNEACSLHLFYRFFFITDSVQDR